MVITVKIVTRGGFSPKSGAICQGSVEGVGAHGVVSHAAWIVLSGWLVDRKYAQYCMISTAGFAELFLAARSHRGPGSS